MQNKPPFPEVFDSSMLGAFKSCPRKYLRQYLQHWAPTEKSIHLVFGGAFARALEVARLAIWRDGVSDEDAIYFAQMAAIKFWGEYEAPEGQNKTLPNLLLAIEEYFTHYGTLEDTIKPYIPANGQPAVEFSFSLPLADDLVHPVTGQPIMYVGRFDMLGEYNKGLYAVDEKTTTRLGPSWMKQWDLRSQFIGYCWAARQFEYNVAGAVVRGISLLKHEFGHAQVIVHCPPHIIKRWHTMTVATIRQILECWKTDTWLHNFDSACTSYSGCPYKILCDKQDEDRWIETNFVQSVWDPMAKD